MTWRQRRVQEMADLINGYPFDSAEFLDDGDVPLVRIRDILGTSFETFVSLAVVPQSAMVRDGDVVTGMDGDFNVVYWSRGVAALNQRVCLLRANGGADMRFLTYVLPAHLQVINDLTYATTVKHLSSDQVRGIRIMAPDLLEQRVIADYLDRETARIDILIEDQQRLIEMLRERRFALRVDVSTHGITPTAKVESPLPWARSLPASWRVVPLTSVARLESGHTPNRSREDWWRDCYIPWVSLHDVGLMRGIKYLDGTAQQISNLGMANSSARLLPARTVVLSRDATVGRTAIMSIPMATSQHFAAWICGSFLDPEYLWVLFADAMQPFFESFQNGSTIRTIGMGDLKAFRIPLPPLDEQRRIVAYLDEKTARIDAIIAEAQRFIDLARERRSALISAAVTGQISVREAA